MADSNLSGTMKSRNSLNNDSVVLSEEEHSRLLTLSAQKGHGRTRSLSPIAFDRRGKYPAGMHKSVHHGKQPPLEDQVIVEEQEQSDVSPPPKRHAAVHKRNVSQNLQMSNKTPESMIVTIHAYDEPRVMHQIAEDESSNDGVFEMKRVSIEPSQNRSN